ncbi:MAG: LPS export ABC transporter permease LptG [Paracoccus sp. (in: a-proteobacteria)]|nr:LPS export ABC transporter permease LptG [Paracoccus sp. (in: a-proteobacteria)]
MILARYVAMRYLRAFVLLSAVFMAILLLIDMVEQIRRFSSAGIGLGGALRLSALSVAGSFYGILPLIGLLAGITLFLGLSRNSEMVAIRASGRSALRLLVAPALMAMLIGAACVAVLNPMVAATEKQYSAEVARIQSGGAQVGLGDSGVWLRQGLDNGAGQMVIRAARTSPDATTLYGATFLLFDPEAGPVTRIEAAEAHLGDGVWELARVKSWALSLPNPESAAQEREAMALPTDLTADRIRDGFGRPQTVPIWQLPGFIEGLQTAGFTATRHQVWFQMELALPLMLAAMVTVAAIFTMRHMRGRRTGMLVLAAFGAGLALFFLRNLAQVLGEAGDVTPEMAAWAPPIIAILFAVGALLRLEDG